MKSAGFSRKWSLTKACFQAGIAAALILSLSGIGQAAELKTIKLNEPNKKRGLPLMEALAVKASALEWSDRELTLQDLSDLVWATTGLNRPEEKKYTASSAQNARDVDLYLVMKDGIYLYDPDHHVLNELLEGDYRSQVIMAAPPPRPAEANTPAPAQPAPRPQRAVPATAPIQVILISETARFRMGSQEGKYEWGALDAGIVSENITLFCAATGLKTRPMWNMNREKIKSLLNLKETQYMFLIHPVGYAK